MFVLREFMQSWNSISGPSWPQNQRSVSVMGIIYWVSFIFVRLPFPNIYFYYIYIYFLNYEHVCGGGANLNVTDTRGTGSLLKFELQVAVIHWL